MRLRLWLIALGILIVGACSDPAGPRIPSPEEEEEDPNDPEEPGISVSAVTGNPVFVLI